MCFVLGEKASNLRVKKLHVSKILTIKIASLGAGSGRCNLAMVRLFTGSIFLIQILQDLIHGAPVGKAVANRCHVTMNYEDDDGNMRAFTRLVTGSGSEYRVDNKVLYIYRLI